MASTSAPRDNPLIRKLDSIFPLSDEERQALENLPLQVTVIGENEDIVREGDRPSQCCLLLSGFACTYKVTGDGKRQITGFNVPGDIADLQSLYLEVLDNSVSTLTPCWVGFITHEALRDICDRFPRIARAFWRQLLIDAATSREWVLNVGQRTAPQRVAHVFCELVLRLRAVGLADNNSCDLPITEAEFADAMGLTPVLVKRVLQAMRAYGLVELSGDRLTIPDWDKLRKAGDFDPTYLHLERDQAAA